MITSIEPILQVKEEMLEMTKAHHEEVNLFNQALNIDWETYIESESTGNYILFTYRNGQKLVGYAGFVVYNHSHHVDKLHARLDILYVDPSIRGEGLQFMGDYEKMLKRHGVSFIHKSIPLQNDWGKILEFKGYDKLEVTYVKEIT